MATAHNSKQLWAYFQRYRAISGSPGTPHLWQGDGLGASSDKKIEVAEFPKIQGFYGERYRFKVLNSAGKEIFCVTLESDALEQPSWATEHPKEAATGGRRFSLDGYASDSHSTYAFYDREPRYEQVREEVKQVLAGKKKVISKTVYPSPQPIPGAE